MMHKEEFKLTIAIVTAYFIICASLLFHVYLITIKTSANSNTETNSNRIELVLYRLYQQEKQVFLAKSKEALNDNDKEVYRKTDSHDQNLIKPDEQINSDIKQQKNDTEPLDNKTSDIQPIPKIEAYFASSLTSANGSVAITGRAYGYSVELDEIDLELNNGAFYTQALSTFSIKFYNEQESMTIWVKSPASSTNIVIQSLNLIIDPINRFITLHGKVALKLPGKISGDFINLSNGSSTSTILENGSFNLTLPLNSGNNQLTAVGRWLTISMELPAIEVVLTD